MSEKGIFFKKRKKKHGSHNKCSRGSEFPRKNMDYYEGTHLGMSKHLNRRGSHIINMGWDNGGYLKDNILLPLIFAHAGKPYKELTKAYYAKTKRLREQHKKVGLDNLEWYFQNFYPYYYGKQFYIDDEGIVRTDSSWNFHNNFTNAQLRHNRDQEIPQYGKVCKDYRNIEWYSREEFPLISNEPVFMGNFYCDIKGKILLLPVYHVPYFKKRKNNEGYYGPNYVSTHLRPNTPENREYIEMCSKWIKPTIAIKRNEVNHLFEHSYIGKVHNTKKDDLLKNIKEWETLRDVATTKKDRKYLKLQLKVLISKYKSTPDFIEKEAGYGRLYPMVKREDYEKVLNNLACSE